MATGRLNLSRTIARYNGLASHCDRVDEEISARESAALRLVSAERAEATQRLETARRIQLTPEKRALQAVMGSVERPGLTVPEAEAALEAIQARHDAAYDQIDKAKREAARLRNSELRGAERARDEAVGAVLNGEGVVADLLARYAATRCELGRLYLGLAALPVLVRPTGQWETPVSLNELQTGDRSLANEIKDFIAALQSDADAPLPGAPSPPPLPDAEAAE